MEKDKSKNGEIANRISSLIEEALSLADGIEENASPEEELTPVSALTFSLYEARRISSDIAKDSSVGP
jgi:hypothetical protein